MITYKKPTREEVCAAIKVGFALLVRKWQAFQNKEHSLREWVFIFTLAMVLGMAGKVIAQKTITIGYEDYLIPQVSNETKLEASVIARGPICEE